MSEEKKNVAQALDDIFDDDPVKRAREKEIAKYEKKRQKALEKEAKKAAKKAAKLNAESEDTDTGEDELSEHLHDGDAMSDAAGANDVDSGKVKDKKPKKAPKAKKKSDNIGEAQGEDKPEANDKAESVDVTVSDDNAEGEDKPDSDDNAENDDIDEKAIRRQIKAEKKAERKAEKLAKKERAAQEKEVNIVKDLLFLCLYILGVVLLCWMILTFVGQRTEVSGESMSNTLHSGDTLWIDKLEYEFGSPKRFDVVVFPPDEEDEETFFIKRVIGLPGETIFIDSNGIIYINDEPLEGDVYGREVIDPDQRGLAAKPVVLGEDEYFVLGDNRNNSRDSRLEAIGNVHKDDIIGRAVFRFTGGFGKIK